MTKIAITSDLHMRFWARMDYLPASWVLKSIEQNNPDILIDAGDLELAEPYLKLVDPIGRGLEYIIVQGNHDFYYTRWHGEPVRDCFVKQVFGLKIAATTLWTDLNNNDPLTHLQVGRGLTDFRVIEGFDTQECYNTHLIQRDWLRKQFPCDIVVTHHSPSLKSVAPKYQGSGLFNYGFSSDLDWLVEESGAKLWIHGHTHEPFDYMIGNTRVICHPCGYPGENGVGRTWNYEPLYVEL